MSALSFTTTVSSHGRKRKIRVYVHDTLEDMYKSAGRYNKLVGAPSVEPRYHAITHTYEKYTVNDDDSEMVSDDVGIIRYVKGYLASYIIVHEIAHATLAIYGMDCVQETDPVFDHITTANETFCHILSELEHNIVSKLNRKGLYDD